MPSTALPIRESDTDGAVSEYLGEYAPVHFDTEATATNGLAMVASILKGSDEALLDAKAKVETKANGDAVQKVSFRAEKQGGQPARSHAPGNVNVGFLLGAVAVLVIGLAVLGMAAVFRAAF